MILVDQTKFHLPESGKNGNCLAASLASILELRLSRVPEFENMEDDKWFDALTNWLEELGFTLLEWNDETWLPGYYLVCGLSPRNVLHQVVYKAGKMVHDPHPSRAGITTFRNQWALLPVDPARYKKFL